MEINLIPETLATEILLLACAFLFSGAIGVEREIRQKTAGVKTHILVGLGSALFTLISAYGFSHFLSDRVILDPSRIAAQIVSGIGFIGAGVIFIRQDIVSGLTTAGSVWVTAAVGMACGAGMPIIAAIAVVFHLLAVSVIPHLIRKLPIRGRTQSCMVSYIDGRGILREILGTASRLGYESALENTKRIEVEGNYIVEIFMIFTRSQRIPPDELIRSLTEMDGVVEVIRVPEYSD